MNSTETPIEFLVPAIAGTILFGLLVAFIIYFILLYRRSQYRLYWEREQLKQELLRVENEVKEQTLTNVSRELHDNLGQVASLIKINLNMISGELKPKDKEKVKESLTLIRQLIGDIKALSASLNGEHIREMGLIRMLEQDISRINAIGGIHIDFHYNASPRFPHDKEVILYRVMQEIINNTLKHSRALEGTLEINADENRLLIQFEDKGIGFDENTVAKGSGLLNIRERCKMIGAQVSIESAQGTGTKINITLEHNA